MGPGARPSMIKTNVSVRVRRRVSFRVSAKAMGLGQDWLWDLARARAR